MGFLCFPIWIWGSAWRPDIILFPHTTGSKGSTKWLVCMINTSVFPVCIVSSFVPHQVLISWKSRGRFATDFVRTATAYISVDIIRRKMKLVQAGMLWEEKEEKKTLCVACLRYHAFGYDRFPPLIWARAVRCMFLGWCVVIELNF